jgi:uncharacterized phage-associated protein
MYNALDVGRYIINYCNEKEYCINNLKLQKILYFIQAWYLYRFNKPCFRDSIEAWSFGPVIPKVYREFKRFGCCDLYKITTYYEVNNNNFWLSKTIEFNNDIIEEDDKEIINAIIDKLSNYSATTLTEITLKQDPWKYAYKKDDANIISNSSIKEFFHK